MGDDNFSYESSFGHAQHRGGPSEPLRLRPALPVSTHARCAGRLDYTAQQSSGIRAWRRDTDHIEKAFVFRRHAGTERCYFRHSW